MANMNPRTNRKPITAQRNSGIGLRRGGGGSSSLKVYFGVGSGASGSFGASGKDGGRGTLMSTSIELGDSACRLITA